MNDSKRWFLSKTVWIGILEVVVAVLALLAGEELIRENPQAVAVLGLIGGVLTIVLRKITNKPLGG